MLYVFFFFSEAFTIVFRILCAFAIIPINIKLGAIVVRNSRRDFHRCASVQMNKLLNVAPLRLRATFLFDFTRRYKSTDSSSIEHNLTCAPVIT